MDSFCVVPRDQIAPKPSVLFVLPQGEILSLADRLTKGYTRFVSLGTNLYPPFRLALLFSSYSFAGGTEHLADRIRAKECTAQTVIMNMIRDMSDVRNG